MRKENAVIIEPDGSFERPFTDKRDPRIELGHHFKRGDMIYVVSHISHDGMIMDPPKGNKIYVRYYYPWET